MARAIFFILILANARFWIYGIDNSTTDQPMINQQSIAKDNGQDFIQQQQSTILTDDSTETQLLKLKYEMLSKIYNVKDQLVKFMLKRNGKHTLRAKQHKKLTSSKKSYNFSIISGQFDAMAKAQEKHYDAVLHLVNKSSFELQQRGNTFEDAIRTYNMTDILAQMKKFLDKQENQSVNKTTDNFNLQEKNVELEKKLASVENELANRETKLEEMTQKLILAGQIIGRYAKNETLVLPNNQTVWSLKSKDAVTWSCDFENGNCSFCNDNSFQSLAWEVGHYPTSDLFPNGDHTFGSNTGKYMKTNCLQRSCTAGTIARMYSKKFEASENYCLQLWYSSFTKPLPRRTTTRSPSHHYFQSRTDSRYIRRKYVETGKQEIRLYTRVNNGIGKPFATFSWRAASTTWTKIKLDMPKEEIKQPFEIAFESECRSKSYLHFCKMAIDDIQLTNKPCSETVPIRKSCCPHGFVDGYLGKSCYLFVLVPKTWREAIKYCKQKFELAHLLAIDTSHAMAFFQNIVKNNPVLSNVQDGWLTSGTDQSKEDTWRWASSPRSEEFSWTKWATGQPNNVGGNQDCLLLEKQPSGEWMWNDVECKKKFSFVCNIPAK